MSPPGFCLDGERRARRPVRRRTWCLCSSATGSVGNLMSSTMTCEWVAAPQYLLREGATQRPLRRSPLPQFILRTSAVLPSSPERALLQSIMMVAMYRGSCLFHPRRSKGLSGCGLS